MGGTQVGHSWMMMACTQHGALCSQLEDFLSLSQPLLPLDDPPFSLPLYFRSMSSLLSGKNPDTCHQKEILGCHTASYHEPALLAQGKVFISKVTLVCRSTGHEVLASGQRWGRVQPLLFEEVLLAVRPW